MSFTTRIPDARIIDTGVSIAARHAGTVTILRFRGLNAEALMATRLDHIEALVAAIRTVLDDQRAARDERPGRSDDRPSDDGLEDTPRIKIDRDGEDGVAGVALEQRRLVEAILEAALARVRRSAETTGPERDEPWATDAGLEEKVAGHGTAS